MAVRNESVRLSLDDQFSSGMARAAAAAAMFKRELDGLDGRRIAGDFDGIGDGIDHVGTSSRRSGPEIDKLSGRLRLLTDAAVTLGPAMIPLGAAAIPALTGALAGLGAAAGGIGATVLAFQGMGDALDAIDKARLEPTAENLQAMRVTLQELGPAGAEFARYLDSLGPLINDLQNTARAGLFPGLEDGINALLERAPQVQRVIDNLATGMGNLARDTGESLSSDAWTPFFDYVERTAQPTMEAFGHAAGNVALGIANMLVAFEPLSSGFTSGLEDATKAFADWSTTLDTNQSFQAFVAYIRESGPQVVEFLGAMAQALAGLVSAAAPLGQIVLPALTAVAQVFATIASSPIGPGLYAAAAGMLAFNRAASVAEKSATRFNTAWAGMSRGRMAAGAVGGLALLATSLTDVDEKAGLANTALLASAGLMVGGPWGAAIGGGIGLVTDFTHAHKDMQNAVESANTAMRDNSVADYKARLEELNAEIQKVDAKGFGTFIGPKDAWETVRAAVSRLTGDYDDLVFAQGAVRNSLKNTGGIADLFGETIGETGDQLRNAASAAQDFAGALAQLNGWFDKREAVRGYKDSVDELRKSLKDGFTREDAANIDAIGRSIIQVASQIKDPGKRANFLEGAMASMQQIANTGGPKVKAAVDEIIGKFHDLGLVEAEPKITADDRRAQASIKKTKGDLDIMGRSTTEPEIAADDNPFRQIYKHVTGDLTSLDTTTAKPAVNVNPTDSYAVLGRLMAELNGLHDRTINVRVNQIGGVTSSAGGHSSLPADDSADGGTVPKSGLPYADRYRYLLADGEEVISNRYGQADRHRSLLKTINANRMADGGTTGGGPFNPGGGAMFVLGDAAEGAARGLKGLKRALTKAETALDKQRSKVDEITSAMSSLSSSVSSKFDLDLGARPSNVWANGSSLSAQIAATTAQANSLPGIIAALKAAGLTGPALSEVLQEMDFSQLQVLAANPGQAGQLGSALGGLYAAQQVAGGAAGQAVYGQQLRDQTKELQGIRHEVRELRKDVKAADKNNQQGQKDNAQNVGHFVNGAAANGHRRGKDGRR